MRNNLNTWDMSLEQFISQFKTIRFEKRIQYTSCFSFSKSCGYDYYMYVDINNLKPINPYTKINKGKKYKSFFSSASSEHVKELAYNYIKSITNGY
jgi:hypothetical protein